MKTYLDCIPCFVRQALDAARMVTDDLVVHEKVVRNTLELAESMRFDRAPPWMGQQIHRRLKSLTGQADPYGEVKRRSNQMAMALYPHLKQDVRNADDPLAVAVHLAIAGNVIDFGCKANVSDDDVFESIRVAMEASLDETTLAKFKQAVERSEDILYLADNTGEIVFDRLLIEQLPTGKVTLVVRGEPIINDATREDAEVAGLSALVEVIDNGTDVPGTIPELCSSEFRERLAGCDLVISKGQGNYETLDGLEKEIFFLLQAKCPVIARHIGCEVGSFVFHKGRWTRERACT